MKDEEVTAGLWRCVVETVCIHYVHINGKVNQFRTVVGISRK